MDKRAIIAAYERAEDETGGVIRADIHACAKRAAAECGVSLDEAIEVLKQHWAGTAGRG